VDSLKNLAVNMLYTIEEGGKILKAEALNGLEPKSRR